MVYLSKTIKIKINRTVILTVALYWCETCSPNLKEKRTLRVFENRVLRSIFGHKRDEWNGENYIMRSIMICIPHHMLFG